MKKILALIGCLVLLLGTVGCGGNVTWNGKTEILGYCTMVEDVSDPYLYAGLVDHVFVGTVEEIEKTVIPKKAKQWEDNFSIYRIRVDESLKGNLVETVECRKLGGFWKDGTMALICAEMPGGVMITDSGLPEVGKQYVFLAYSQPDGSLHLSELFDDRECDEALLSEYRDYVEHRKTVERERFSSKYDR